MKHLQEEGIPLELVLAEGKSNTESLEIYRTADIVFDQCLIGFHGYFAQEAMALGKPVMCYIRTPDKYLLHPEESPIINITPDTIQDTLRDMANHRGRLREIGMRSRAYIEKYHTPRHFAERLKKAYEKLGVGAT
ncbi:MAG: glycosyltransferase [Planctomycetota bacterium]